MRGFGARGWMRRVGAALLAIVLAAYTGGPEAPGTRTVRRHGATSRIPAPGSHFMRVALDPETGAPGMPPAAMPFEALQEPSAPPRIETMPNGMMILHHDGHFRNYSLAGRDSNGRIWTDCAAGAAAARQAAANAPADSAPRDASGRVVR